MTLEEYTKWYNGLPLWFRIWNGFRVKISYLKPIFGLGLSYNEKLILNTFKNDRVWLAIYPIDYSLADAVICNSKQEAEWWLEEQNSDGNNVGTIREEVINFERADFGNY